MFITLQPRSKQVSNIPSKKNTKIYIELKKNWELYLFVFPVIVYVLIFQYWPMYGVQIAFKDFVASKGIAGSEWVGLKHFIRFFESYQFIRVLKNTIVVSAYQIVIGFPAPIILALMMNELAGKRFKKVVQTFTYIPHFLSTVVLVGMITAFFSSSGVVNALVQLFNQSPIAFMTEKDWFKPLYILSGVWQNAGWGSIIYMASLAGIDQELYEAAIVDGASKFKRLINITIPGIMPIVIIMLILNLGQIMNIGFEKVFLMQNDLILDSAEVISTYVYKVGLLSGRYDYATAVGLFNSVINFTLLISVNKISKKYSGNSLW